MNALLRHLRLEPHGQRLMTSSAAFWLFSARVLVFAMAAAETVAWGYLGFLFGEGPVRWIAAAFMGAIIFLVVWMIDVSLITLDRAWKEHAREILGRDLRRPRLLDVITFGLRILLLVGSLTVTAPYLAQVVFHNDIQRYVDREAVGAIDAARRQLVDKHDSVIGRKSKEIEEKRLRYEQEVAGKGPSGRYGAGPAAQAMLGDVKKLEGERDDLLRDRERAFKDFDGLASNWGPNREKLAASYNVAVPQASVLENRRALDALRKRPEYRSAELAVKAFLGFIFAGLLLLKLFEPSSARLYLSDVLQQEFGRYLAGTFDSMLPTTERSTNSRFEMSPQRFHDFLVRVWVPARRLEAQQADAHARTSAVAQNLDLLEQMKVRVDNELGQAVAEVRSVCTTMDEASKSLTELHSAIVTVGADLAYYQGELATLEAPRSTLDEKSQLQYEMKRLEYRSHLQRKIAAADRALHELNEAVPTETERFNRATAALKRVETKLEEKEAELAVTQSKIRAVRDQLLLSASDRAQSLLKPATS